MENYQLLPCPFCDHKAEFRLSPQMKWHYVSCTIPYCVGEVHPDRCCPTETKEAAAIRWNTRASGWVSVVNALPENEGKYLVFDQSGRTKIAEFCKKHSAIYHKWYELGFAPLPTVTHWQPLPQPPKQ